VPGTNQYSGICHHCNTNPWIVIVLHEPSRAECPAQKVIFLQKKCLIASSSASLYSTLFVEPCHPDVAFFVVHCYFPLTHSAVWAHQHYSYQMPTSASPWGLRQPYSVHLVFIILVVHWLWVPHLMADEALCWLISLETSLSPTHSAWVWHSTVFWSCIVSPTTLCFCLGQFTVHPNKHVVCGGITLGTNVIHILAC